MPIINCLKRVLEEKLQIKMTMHIFWRMTGFASSTASKITDKDWVPNKKNMEVICETFNIQPGEFLLFMQPEVAPSVPVVSPSEAPDAAVEVSSDEPNFAPTILEAEQVKTILMEKEGAELLNGWWALSGLGAQGSDRPNPEVDDESPVYESEEDDSNVDMAVIMQQAAAVLSLSSTAEYQPNLEFVESCPVYPDEEAQTPAHPAEFYAKKWVFVRKATEAENQELSETEPDGVRVTPELEELRQIYAPYLIHSVPNRRADERPDDDDDDMPDWLL